MNILAFIECSRDIVLLGRIGSKKFTSYSAVTRVSSILASKTHNTDFIVATVKAIYLALARFPSSPNISNAVGL